MSKRKSQNIFEYYIDHCLQLGYKSCRKLTNATKKEKQIFYITNFKCDNAALSSATQHAMPRMQCVLFFNVSFQLLTFYIFSKYYLNQIQNL